MIKEKKCEKCGWVPHKQEEIERNNMKQEEINWWFINGLCFTCNKKKWINS